MEDQFFGFMDGMEDCFDDLSDSVLDPGQCAVE